MVNKKFAHQQWWKYFILALIGYSLGSSLITYGLFGPIPPNSCNTPGVNIVFNDSITGNLTPTTPNITTHLGHCAEISIYSFNDIPFTLQIIDDEDNLYIAVPNFANDTTNHQYIVITLFYNDYSLLALRETTDAPVNISVIASFITPVLPCLDIQWFAIRYGLTTIGIFILIFSIFSTVRLYQILRHRLE